jgi:hypothetical protein
MKTEFEKMVKKDEAITKDQFKEVYSEIILRDNPSPDRK